MQDEEIEDLLGQTQDHIQQGYGTKLQLRRKRADAAYDYARARSAINQSNAFAGVARGVGQQFPNDSVYDEGITGYDLDKGINTYRDSKQSDLLALGNTAAHFGTAFGSAYATAALISNPYGLGLLALATVGQALYNATDDVDNDNPISWISDNLIFKTLGKTKELIDENTPVYTEDADKEGLVARNAGLGGLDQFAQGLGFLFGGMSSAAATASKLGPGSTFYKSINKAMGGAGYGATAEAMSIAGQTASAEAAQIAKAKKFTDGVTGFTSTLIGRFGETVLERQGTKDEMLQNGYSENEAEQAANMSFMANLALSLPDYIQNVKMLGVFDKVLPKLGAPVGKYSGAATKYFRAGADKVGKYDKATDVITAFGKNAVFEGGEEGLQYAFNKGSQDTVASGEGWLDFITRSVPSEFGKSFTTEEGQMSWILGGLLGGGASALNSYKNYDTPKQLASIWKDYNNLKKDLDANFKIDENALYTEYKNPEGGTQKVINPDYIEKLTNNSQLESVKEYARGQNNEELYNAAKNKQILNEALFNLSVGEYDNYKAKLQKTDITLDELKAMKALQQNKKLSEVEVTPKDLEEFKKESAEALKISEDFKKSYETALNLPGFANLSKPAMMKFADILASQKAINSELTKIRPEILPALEEYAAAHQEVYFPKDTRRTKAGNPDLRVKENKEAFKNQALTTTLDALKDPIEKANLQNQYDKYKELNVTNKQLIQQYKDILEDPAKLERQVQAAKLNEFKAEMQSKIDETKAIKDLNYKFKAKHSEKNPHTIQVTDAEGNVKEYITTVVDGVHKIIEVATGKEVTLEELGNDYIIAPTKTDLSEFEEEDEEGDKPTYNPRTESAPKKTSFFASTGSVWRFIRGKGYDLNEEGDYILNGENEDLSRFMANPENTPGVNIDFKPAKTFSWQLDVSEVPNESMLQEIADEVNSKRNAKYNKPLTVADLKTNPAYRLIKMTLYENGKPVTRNGKAITCFMHDINYYNETVEYDQIEKNDKLTREDKEAQHEANRIKLIEQRKFIIDTILKNGKPMYSPVVSKSGGVLSRIPNINGKHPNKNIVGRVVKNLKSLVEHSSMVPIKGSMKLVPGLGTVQNVIDNGDRTYSVTVKYIKKDGNDFQTEEFVTSNPNFKRGYLVFNDIKANGESEVIMPFYKNEFSDEDLNGLVDSLHYFITKQSNKITLNGKEVNLFSSGFVKDGIDSKDRPKGPGIIDSLLNIYGKSTGTNSKKRVNVFFEDGQYKLKLGYKVVDPATVTKADIIKFFNDNHPAGLRYQLKNYAASSFKDGFSFPKSVSEDGVAEGTPYESYLNFLFDSDSPRIGTDVSKEFKFSNAYMVLGTEGDNVMLSSSPTVQAQPKAPDKPKPKPKPNDTPVFTEESILKRIKLQDEKLLKELTDEELIYIVSKHYTAIGESIVLFIPRAEAVKKFTEVYGSINPGVPATDMIAAQNPEAHNEFIKKIRFVKIDPIKTKEEVTQKICDAGNPTKDVNDFGF
jgi:hypothetical protein